MAAPLLGVLGKLSSSVQANTAKLGTLGALFGDAVKMQTAAIRVSRDMGSIMEKVGNLSKDLPAGIAIETEATIAGMEAGFRTYNGSINKLWTQMKLTGQNSAAMMRQFKNLESITGLSNEALGSVAEKTLELSDTYGVTTESVVQSLGALSTSIEENSNIQLLQGNKGEALTTALAEAGAQLGPGYEKQLSAFAQMLTSGDEAAFRLRSLAGLHDVAAKIANNTITAEELLAANEKAAQFSRDTIGPAATTGALASYGTEQVMGAVAGNQAKALQASLKMSEQFAKGLSDEQKAENLANAKRKEFSESLQALGTKTLAPWKDIFLSNFDKFMGILTPIFGILQDLGSFASTHIGPILSILAAVTEVAVGYIRQLVTFGEGIYEEVRPVLISMSKWLFEFVQKFAIIFRNVWTFLKPIFIGIWEGVVGMLKAMAGPIMQWIDKVIGFWAALSPVIMSIATILAASFKFIGGFIGKIVGWFFSVLGPILEFMGKAFGFIISVLGPIFMTIAKTLAIGFKFIGGFISKIAGWLFSVAGSVMEFIGKILSEFRVLFLNMVKMIGHIRDWFPGDGGKKIIKWAEAELGKDGQGPQEKQVEIFTSIEDLLASVKGSTEKVAEEGVEIKEKAVSVLGVSQDALAVAIAGIVQEPFSEIVAMNETLVDAIDDQTGVLAAAASETTEATKARIAGGLGPKQQLAQE